MEQARQAACRAKEGAPGMIEQLLPPGVAVVEAFEDRLGEPVFPGEETKITKESLPTI